MKCADSASDRKADAVVRASGQPCDEYGTYLASDGAICSWIPVNDGQKIVVETSFVGMTKEIQIDLVIDGILRNSEKTNRKAEKKDRKFERFEHGFYAQSKSVINQAELEVKTLDVSSYPSIQVEGTDSVGTIEVRISVLRDEHEERHKLDDVKSFETIMDWKEAYRTPSYTKIRPVQQVDFVPIDQQPTKIQVTKLKQRATARRPGAKPWVVFRFYYRPSEAINNEALTKTQSKTATKFDPPPIVKTDVEAPSPSTASLLAGTTTATTPKEPSTKAGTATTTAEGPPSKAVAVAEASSTKAASATTTAEVPGNKETATNDAAQTEVPKLPVEDSKDAVTQSTVSSADLGSEQPDLVSEANSTSLPADSSSNKSTEEQSFPIDQHSIMATIETLPLAATNEALDAIMADVAGQILADELQQAPIAKITGDGARADSPQPLNQAPAAKMISDLGTAARHLTPPSTLKLFAEESALPKPSAIVASVFDTSPSRENTPAADIVQDVEAIQAKAVQEVTKEVPEPIVERIELTVESVAPITPPKSTQKVKIEPSRSSNALKRTFSATPTPDPSIKRMKLENGELEKRFAEKKKALAEKRANRIKSQNKASEAQQKAANAEVSPSSMISK